MPRYRRTAARATSASGTAFAAIRPVVRPLDARIKPRDLPGFHERGNGFRIAPLPDKVERLAGKPVGRRVFKRFQIVLHRLVGVASTQMESSLGDKEFRVAHLDLSGALEISGRPANIPGVQTGHAEVEVKRERIPILDGIRFEKGYYVIVFFAVKRPFGTFKNGQWHRLLGELLFEETVQGPVQVVKFLVGRDGWIQLDLVNPGQYLLDE